MTYLNWKLAAVFVLIAISLVLRAQPAMPNTDEGQPAKERPKLGVPIRYQLPNTPGQTYRVTLAITDAKNPDWIVSTFVAGAARTVTAENRGEFEETWDGLDENFMPVPPGSYGVKGIFMSAERWAIDDDWHSVTPRFVTEASAWRAPPGSGKHPHIGGDPVHSPIGDVDIAANGVGVFCYQYLENSRNFYHADFKRPIDYDQMIASFNSGGAAGGRSVATDGITSWVFENEGFVFRTDQKPFGQQNARFRQKVYLPEGHVTAMAAWRDEQTGKSFVYLAQRRRLIHQERGSVVESKTDRIDKIAVLDGVTAESLAEVVVPEPMGVVARWGDRLWVLHRAGEKYAVSAVPLRSGLPQGPLEIVLFMPTGIAPSDLEVDSRGRIYLADAAANQVYQFAADGKRLRTFGTQKAQKSGSYDPQTFMSPEKIACWRDAGGRDHLVVMERHGPSRVSEWDAEDGTLKREWLTAQTYANDGYAVDPRQPNHLYVRGQGGSLVRWYVNYETGAWKVDAVWPDTFPNDSPLGWSTRRTLSFPRMLYHGDTRFLAFGRGSALFREAGDRWLPSAALVTEVNEKKNETRYYIFRDANGDGQVQPEEYKDAPTSPPKGTIRYWGESWQDDLSLVAIQLGTPDVWRLAPNGFDEHGNPKFDPDGWKKLLTDSVLDARRKGTATALFGANEMGESFSSSWGMVRGTPAKGYLVNVRGPDKGANFGTQHKLSHYVPDGKGGYRLKWRVGRVALQGTAAPGEIYGSMHVAPPVGGLVAIFDQSRMGVLLYTEEGLYVDTIFADVRRLRGQDAGPYTQGGEFFAGSIFIHNGKIYLAVGKPTILIFELLGWTAKANPARPLQTLPPLVTIAASQIAPAPKFALAVRQNKQGGSASGIARFIPMPGGGPALDGSLKGWENCEPITFRSDDKQNVEVRCGYDPLNIYLRWHARLGRKVQPTPLSPADRILTHDRRADTLSFYLQGDPTANPPKSREGRAGDVRFVFGLFENGSAVEPAILGMYPKWTGGKASPLTYKSPVGTAVFEHVGLVDKAKLGHKIDADGQGFVITAAIPRTDIPLFPAFAGAHRTQVNFDATFGGHNRFWWSNADGSATRETYDEPTEAHLYPGSWSQAQFEPIEGLVVRTWNVIGPFGFADLTKLRHREDRPQIVKSLTTTAYPPEKELDPAARYIGDLTQTRRAKRELKWRSANISGDVVKLPEVLGWKAYEDEGTAYLFTSINTPEATEVQLRPLDGHGHHIIRAWHNQQPLGELPPSEKVQEAQRKGKPIAATRTLPLQKGWNDLLVRFDLIWGESILGLRLEASPEILWKLRFDQQLRRGN